MSSAAVGTHSGAGPLSLMSCVRESSPLQDYEPPDTEKNAATKKKFWNPKKWFKRKNKATEDAVIPVEITEKDVLRSRSTSELSITEEQTRRRSGSSMHPGLSVSHDSVFHSPNSGSDIELDAAQSSSSLSISQPQIDLRLQTELSERLRLRRGRGDTSEDDEGLPHSPCNSPTTTDALLDKTAIKDLPTKSHSTCSDGSLLSMGSSEMDEDFFGQQSRHSSKLSLHEKRSSDQDSDLELGPCSSSAAPLNHSAAHHRVAVRPKRRAPHRNKRVPQLSTALPTTPEVNEESSIRSMTPENISREAVTELYSMSTKTTTTLVAESQLKCSSLPPGLAAPGSEASKLNRSRSNAGGGGSKSQDHFATLEEDVEKEEKSAGDKSSFFDRIFPRRSGKKRKSKEDKTTTSTTVVATAAATATSTSTQSYSKQTTVESSASYSRRTSSEAKPIAAPRSGAAARQRIQPIDLPPSPETAPRRDFECILPKPSPEKCFGGGGTSPLHAELESRFKQRQTFNASLTPPQSPKNVVESSSSSSASVISKLEFASNRKESKNEEIKSGKMKIPPGLSSLQQRVLSLNDDDDDNDNDDVDDAGFKSLTDLPLPEDVEVKPVKPVTKSHSFKSVKPAATAVFGEAENKFVAHRASETMATMTTTQNKRISMAKAASLDSVKHLEESPPPPPPKQLFEKKKSEEVVVVDNNEVIKRESSEIKHESSVVDDVDELKIKEDVVNTIKEFVSQSVMMDDITISGPSHTAVVSVSSNSVDSYDSANSKTETVTTSTGMKEVTTKESVSVTKIQVKRESTQITQSTVTLPKSSIPEFLNRQLNKVEAKPSSNVVFSMNSPRIIDEQSRPKTNRNFPRKFSQDEIEIVEKTTPTPTPTDDADNDDIEKFSPPSLITVIPMTVNSQPRFKKNADVGNKRKSSASSSTTTPESPRSEKPFPRSRSISLDSLKGEAEASDKSSQDSLDKLEEETVKEKSSSSAVESVVLRKKSLIKQKNDEEPELMKVFARRSLKLKDSESESVSQQVTAMLAADADDGNDAKTAAKDSSDKENQAESPKEERKKSLSKEFIKLKEPLNESKVIKKEEFSENREPLVETMKTVTVTGPIKEQPKIKDTLFLDRKYIETAEVTLRKPNNNNFYSRAFSVNPPRSCEMMTEMKVKKQASFCERRRTDNWISNIKNGDDLIERKISQDEIITGISPKSDFISTAELITETKNFNQRKAEWEKRAQEAQKKSVP